jgi:hypothetical protein
MSRVERDGFDVFTCTWWRKDSDWPRGLEPCPRRRYYIARGVTEERAREVCEEYNTTHKPGLLSRKAEYWHT